ncbi:MAG TPA: RdgB/HAM1 family non-canonical purine NTP pyrophosphatase [Symbiobacteriaceae bacterium]|nr:RdgB/HAM1 family non-canonical purine NTP pyrophosphatase [Symbiobacteriaceae bacterium]
MPAKRLVLASKNPGKIRELQALFAPTGIEVIGLDPAAPDVEETGTTFEENALIKARAAATATGLPALGEDSGLAVDALGGEPGIRSARWVPGSDADRMYALLDRMQNVPEGQRGARYVSCIALVTPAGREEVVRGELEGSISWAPRGSGGFGYDPIFLLPDGRTTAEITMEAKNTISHRARALAQAMAILPRLLEG